MFIYQFTQSDGYYSEILLHKEKFTPEELENICEGIDVEAPFDLDKKCNWLIEYKGFEKVGYTIMDLYDGAYERGLKE